MLVDDHRNVTKRFKIGVKLLQEYILSVVRKDELDCLNISGEIIL